MNATKIILMIASILIMKTPMKRRMFARICQRKVRSKRKLRNAKTYLRVNVKLMMNASSIFIMNLIIN